MRWMPGRRPCLRGEPTSNSPPRMLASPGARLMRRHSANVRQSSWRWIRRSKCECRFQPAGSLSSRLLTPSQQTRNRFALREHVDDAAEAWLKPHFGNVENGMHDGCEKIFRRVAIGGGLRRGLVRLADHLTHLESTARQQK